MISFVVPAYNEAKYLAATLESIHAAAKEVGEPYEIVVANDASTDATPEIAEKAGARVVTVNNRQIAATRNSGARASTGEALFFVDGDTWVSAALVKEALAALRSGAVGGGARVTFHGEVPRWVHGFMVIFTPLYFGVGRWAAGCFVFCTRAAFDATGGFDETTFAGEEIHFSRALKTLGRFVIVRERVATSARKVEHRTFWDTMRVNLKIVRSAGFDGRIKRREDAGFWYEDRR
ncbi:MAG TPA: glycosyltransferase [Usitatibacter sp.]|nr:glycosyltransferase [Usitatibacter sp.]